MKFVLFDFEVFLKDWLVVFKYPNQEYIAFINDYEGVKQFFNQHKNDVFIGYNNRHYDDHILKAILSDLNPYKVSCWIINDKKNGWQFPGLNKIYFHSLDLMQDIEGAIGISLKEIESNLGLSIEESSVDFLINRKLTNEELQEVLTYCKHDVDATEKLMEVRSTYLKGRLQVINLFNLPLNCLAKTNAQLTAEVMNPRKKEYTDYGEYNPPKELQLSKYKHILSLYEPPLDKSKHIITNICGIDHRIGFGGLHGATEKKYYNDDKSEILNCDVASYYPSLIIKFGYMCRGVPDPKRYEQIYKQRLEWKKQKDPRANAYKLILNTTFGAMGHEYNKLYDLKQNTHICVTGQLFLIDLLEKLEPYINHIQSNTDGIMFQTNSRSICENIIHDWEKRTGMNMEFENIKQVYQKDVNNYIVEHHDGKIKTKGAYVKNYKGGNYTSNSMTIIDDAIVDYLLFKIPIEDTIKNCNDPIRFQITTKKGPTYKQVEWQLDNQFVITNNVNRVFATYDKKYGKLFKVKQNSRRDTIASLPNNCLVFNKDLSLFDINLVNKQWYIEEAHKRVKDFIGG